MTGKLIGSGFFFLASSALLLSCGGLLSCAGKGSAGTPDSPSRHAGAGALSEAPADLFAPSGRPAATVRLITLDPGHFHAALVQKTMYDQVSPDVFVYAPEGPDVEDHLKRIEGFNTRPDNPTRWIEHVYRGKDFLERMLREKRGNVVVLSGDNGKKAKYIAACIAGGFNVLADKPMCIDASGCSLLEKAFDEAAKKGLLLYDIMTERSEITTILQKRFVHDAALFGALLPGTAENPSVVKESVHHFFKYVAGRPNKRPPWFFDTARQGEGLVDVTTHLADLVMWECFPGAAIDFDGDIVIDGARRWPTLLTREQFEKATLLDDFTPDLKSKLNGSGLLPCFANGEILFTIRGVHAKVKVRWHFQAPPGAKDTHFSVMRGTLSSVFIRQGKEQNYRPELYVEPAPGADRAAVGAALGRAVAGLQGDYPGVAMETSGSGWHVTVPAKYRLGHEAHFRQVMERYLKALAAGSLPAWEVPNMIAKYRLTTEALEKALPPKGARVLFDGSGFDAWRAETGGPVRWTIDEGAMRVVPGSGSIMTKENFRDFQLHLEFKVPELPPLKAGQDRGNRGNSGIYLQRRYEVQILDSFGKTPTDWDCGALYRFRKPDANASRPAGAWQSYDIIFLAPEWRGDEKVKDARIWVIQNGMLIHNRVDLSRKTGHGLPEGPGAGPILLQDHGNPVEFRNIRIVPIERDASERQPNIPIGYAK